MDTDIPSWTQSTQHHRILLENYEIKIKIKLKLNEIQLQIRLEYKNLYFSASLQ